jgi:hypothetical protein
MKFRVGAMVTSVKCLTLVSFVSFLTSCNETVPSCDAARVTVILKEELLKTFEPKSTTPYCGNNGCNPYFKGGAVQFSTLELKDGARNSNNLPTFTMDKASFVRAINVRIREVRTMGQNEQARSTSCAAVLEVKINFDDLDPKLLSTSIVEWKGFTNVKNPGLGVSSPREGTRTVKEKLENVPRMLQNGLPIKYALQFTTNNDLYFQFE